MSEEFIEKVRNWTTGDKKIVTTFFLKKAMNNGESEDEFIERVSKTIQSEWGMSLSKSTVDSVKDLPPLSSRRKWRRLPNGKIEVGP